MFGIGKYIGIGAAIALAIALAWGSRVDHLRAGWKSKYGVLSEQSAAVLVEARIATGNKRLKWESVPESIREVAASRNFWHGTAQEQSAKIDRLALDTARLKRLNAELRKKAQVAIDRRQKAIDELEKSAIDPGDKADCIAQINAANSALDKIYSEGL